MTRLEPNADSETMCKQETMCKPENSDPCASVSSDQAPVEHGVSWGSVESKDPGVSTMSWASASNDEPDNRCTRSETLAVVLEEVKVLKELFENSGKGSGKEKGRNTLLTTGRARASGITAGRASGLNLSAGTELKIPNAWEAIIGLLEHVEQQPVGSFISAKLQPSELTQIACTAVSMVRDRNGIPSKEVSKTRPAVDGGGNGVNSSRNSTSLSSLKDGGGKADPSGRQSVSLGDGGRSSRSSLFLRGSQTMDPSRRRSSFTGLMSDMFDADMMDDLSKNMEKQKPIYLIHPSHPARIVWDVLSLMIVLIDSVLMPFEMAYRANAPEHEWFWFGTFFFCCDILINFFTAYNAGPLERDHGQLVVDIKRIAKHYLKGWFLIDFASTVPWSWLVSKFVGDAGASAGSARMAKIAKIAKLARFMRLARMLKLLKLQTLWENFESMIGSLMVVHILQLFKVLGLIAFMCHWNACIWWSIGNPYSIFNDGDPEQEATGHHWTTVIKELEATTVDGTPWSFSYRWLDRTESESYIFCFYWTLGVMRTMPVEVYPVNEMERFYVLCFMFLAFSVFSICVSKITTMYNKINSRRSDFDENMAALRSYMHEMDVGKDLQGRIKSFLEFKYVKRRIFAREQMLLKELSESLHADLRAAKVVPTLKSVWFFRDLAQAELNQIVLIVQEDDKAPGDILITKGQVAKQAWLLVSGELTIDDPKAEKRKRNSSKRLKSGEFEIIKHVDIDSLFSMKQTVSERSVWASDYSELLIIDKQEFNNARQMHPELDHQIVAVLQTDKGIEAEKEADRNSSAAGLNGEVMVMKKMTSMRRRTDKSSYDNKGPDTTGAVVSAVG